MNAGRILAVEQRGDNGQGAVAQAIREHGMSIARVCMALLGDRGLVESALERVAKEAGDKGLPADRSAKVFLMGLAHRACTALMSKTPFRKDEAPATERTGDVAAASDARATLAQLKPTEREALVLQVVGGLDVKDVAAACGIDPKVARERIGRALGQISSNKESGR